MSWGWVSAHRAIKVLRSGYGVIVLLMWEAFPFSFSAFAQPAACDLLPYPIPSLSGTQTFVTHKQRLASVISAFLTKGLAVGSLSSSLGSTLFLSKSELLKPLLLEVRSMAARSSQTSNVHVFNIHIFPLALSFSLFPFWISYFIEWISWDFPGKRRGYSFLPISPCRRIYSPCMRQVLTDIKRKRPMTRTEYTSRTHSGEK